MPDCRSPHRRTRRHSRRCPVICDDVRIEEEGEAQELENELNALRGSIDVTYRQQQEERKEGGGGGAV